jgi:hypothetical protein
VVPGLRAVQAFCSTLNTWKCRSGRFWCLVLFRLAFVVMGGSAVERAESLRDLSHWPFCLNSSTINFLFVLQFCNFVTIRDFCATRGFVQPKIWDF